MLLSAKASKRSLIKNWEKRTIWQQETHYRQNCKDEKKQ